MSRVAEEVGRAAEAGATKAIEAWERRVETPGNLQRVLSMALAVGVAWALYRTIKSDVAHEKSLDLGEPPPPPSNSPHE